MKIGILGAGKVGGTLGKTWTRAGHEVMFGTRDPEAEKITELLKEAGSNASAGTHQEAVSFGDAVLLAIPWPALGEVLPELSLLEGKILIDATNRRQIPTDSAGSAAEDIARLVPGARVVKAFNTTGSANMANPQYGDSRIDNYICGDDVEAKAIVGALSEEIGFDVVDVGPLSSAGFLESLALLWIHLAYRQGMGPAIAFKLLKR